MAKNRVIPFGYCMRNGEVTVDFAESKAVIEIFEEYLNGSSLMQIAKLMESEKIRYTADSEHWNKNMVKRIIENKKYLGSNKYPQIISKIFFTHANEKRVKKAPSVLKYFRTNRKNLKSMCSRQQLILNCCKTVLKKRFSSLRITSTARKKSIRECWMSLTLINKSEVKTYPNCII